MGTNGKLAAIYVAMLGAAIGTFVLVRELGRGLEAALPAAAEVALPTGAAPPTHALAKLLLALFVVVAVARLMGSLLALTGQPPVVGEIVAGILLGPSLLGRLFPRGETFLFPPGVTDHLGVVAQLGVIAFMFLVGLELDLGQLRSHSRSLLMISHASIVAPFSLGVSLALYLYPRYAPPHVAFGVFALFCGVALSVTAFPVLARILTDRGLKGTPLGDLALGCAAADDASAWCLLALVTGVARAEAGGGVMTTVLAVLYVVVTLLVVRPFLVRLARRVEGDGSLSKGTMTVVVASVLLSALATEWIGIHALFGAFFLGALVPHHSRLARDLADHLGDFVVVVLLPAFFALTGLRTELGLLDSLADVQDLVLVVVVASAGKFGGAFLSGRLTGLSRRDASMLGVLMNTRGLMELIVLNVGLELGVLSPRLFAILVLMAIVTTAGTTPMVRRLMRTAEPATR
jgi:K+:H+ antiporter